MDILMRCYDRLRARQPLDAQDCAALMRQNLHSFQLASLACMLRYKRRMEPCEADLFGWIVARHPAFVPMLADIFEHTDQAGLPPILRLTKARAPIGRANFDDLIGGFVRKAVSPDVMALWLVVVLNEGLSSDDLHHLVHAMIATGEVYDLRDAAELRGRQLIRRYPTGALSEKIALILPALLSALSHEHPILSTLFVGRSLGFTGGTWDKLGTLPGFTFPTIGPDMLAVLRECDVVYAVTSETCVPADRMLYDLRHLTGTIESLPLLVSSIASKHLAIPPHRLLLDIRYGPGAFVKTRSAALTFRRMLTGVITAGGVPCTGMLTDTAQPTGMAIGNSLEVAEAICIMRNDFDNEANNLWDCRALQEQKGLVIASCVELLRREFPGRRVTRWREQCQAKFASGQVLSAFRHLLTAHGVASDAAENIITNPQHLFAQSKRIDVCAESSGTLIALDQRALGHIVNFRLSNVANGTGVVLRKRLGDAVCTGDRLATMFTPATLASDEAKELADAVRRCFTL